MNKRVQFYTRRRLVLIKSLTKDNYTVVTLDKKFSVILTAGVVSTKPRSESSVCRNE